MKQTQESYRGSPPDRRRTASSGISFGNLVADGLRIGPAPSRSREIVAALTTFVLLGAIIVVVEPGLPVSAVAAGASVALFVVRWIVGTRQWSQR